MLGGLVFCGVQHSQSLAACRYSLLLTSQMEAQRQIYGERLVRVVHVSAPSVTTSLTTWRGTGHYS